MSVQITLGAGLKEPQGRRVEVGDVAGLARTLSTLPPAVEAWWAPHLWRGDARDSDAWESSAWIAIDIDREKHQALPEEQAIQLEAAARGAQFSGSVFHRTPAGARVVFALDVPCTDQELFAVAARGAAGAVLEDLREIGLDVGLSLDPTPHADLARLFFTPNSIAKGVRRSADVVVMRRQPYSVDELAALAPVNVSPAISRARPLPSRDAAKRAAAYVAAMGYSVEGNHGDDHAFKVAATLVNDFALSDSEAWSLFCDWNRSCAPPWPERDLKRFLRSGGKNGSHPVGGKLLEDRPWPTQNAAPAPAPAPAPSTPSPEAERKGIPLVRACDAIEKPVEWVVEPFLARGELTDLSGDPGVGKGGITASWAAQVTRENPEATVIFFATEDPLGRVKARLRAEGADLSRVLLLDISRPDANPILPGDIGQVEAMVREHGAALLILDPALEFMQSDLDSHKQQDVARFMGPLLGVAQRTGAALLTVRHLNKTGGSSALYRASGSIGFTGKVRIALLASKDAEGGSRALAVTKNNLGKDKHTVGFDVVSKGDSSVIAWGEVLSTSADELVNQEPKKKKGRPPASLEAAQDFLTDILAKGPVKVDDILRCGKSAGLTQSAIYRAKQALGAQKVTLELRAAWRLREMNSDNNSE